MDYWEQQLENAQDEYNYYRRKYQNSYSDYKTCDRKISSFQSQQTYYQNMISNLRNNRLNFEKRLKGLQDIVKKLDSSGGMFSDNVPDKIATAANHLVEIQEAYEKSIVFGDVSSADISDAFKVKTVTEQINSDNALRHFKRKRDELQTALDDVKKSIAKAEDEIKDLKTQIRALEDTQRQLQSTMRNCTINMNMCDRNIRRINDILEDGYF